MNKLLEDLVSQASEEVWGNNPYNGSPDFEGYALNSEKFAELMLKECEVALSPMLRDMISRGKAVELIKEHFGVK